MDGLHASPDVKLDLLSCEANETAHELTGAAEATGLIAMKTPHPGHIAASGHNGTGHLRKTSPSLSLGRNSQWPNTPQGYFSAWNAK